MAGKSGRAAAAPIADIEKGCQAAARNVVEAQRLLIILAWRAYGMIALFALTIVPAANGMPPGIIPLQFRGQWHAGDAPCNDVAPGLLNVLDHALILEAEENGSVDEIEFGVHRVRKLGDREMLAVGNWRENTIDSQNTPVRLSLSRNRNWLTLRVSGWQKRYARCPIIR